MKKFIIGTLTMFMSLTVFAGVSFALPANNGYGWQIGSANGIAYGLKHNSTYTVEFADKNSLTKSKGYMTNTINYLNGMPEMKKAKIRFVLSSGLLTLPSNLNNCSVDALSGTVTIGVRYRPMGKKDYSITYSCFDSDGLATGGYMLMDSEYWDVASSHNRTKGLRNIHAHEFGHILGLKHPKYFSNSNLRPVMSDPAGGYQNWKTAGRYPDDDTRGVRRLIANGN